MVSCPFRYQRRCRPAVILPSSHFSHVLPLVFINSFLRKTSVSGLNSLCNFPSVLAEWIQPARSYFSLGTTKKKYEWLYLHPAGTKSDVKSIMGRRKGSNYKSKICEIILVPGQWEVAVRKISSICQLGSFNEHVTERKGGTLKCQLQLSRPKWASASSAACAFISNMTGR